MIAINDYIYLDVSKSVDINQSFCNTIQDKTYLYLTFALYANDCLFDLAENNYLFNIRIAKTYFEKYGELIDINVEKQNICCNTQAKLLDIVNCNLTGIHRKIFLESTILYLLYQSQKSSLVFQIGCDTCPVLNNPVDTEKIHLAKNYIIENIENNLTIPIISAFVGTNQCYLKKGFKEIFNQTIFEFIQDNRMVKAKYLLQNTTQSITTIAFSVGYSSLSSFSQAYKNYFGITPFRQNKKDIPNI